MSGNNKPNDGVRANYPKDITQSQRNEANATVFILPPKEADLPSFIGKVRTVIGHFRLTSLRFAGQTTSFHIFATLKDASDVAEVLSDLDAEGIKCSKAREPMLDGKQQSLDRAKDGEYRNIPAGNPNSALEMGSPSTFPAYLLPKLMKNYVGFQRMENSNRRAVFADSLTACMALEDLLRMNMNVKFKEWSSNQFDKIETSNQSPSIMIRNIPCSDELEGRTVSDEEPVPSFEWGRVGVVAALYGFFSRFDGFVKLAFRVDSVLYVDFVDSESARVAAQIVGASTTLLASIAKARPSDEAHYPLERFSTDIFVRTEPPGFSIEEAEALLDRYGGLLEVAPSGTKGCIAKYASVQKASEVVQSLRNSTNLVANFSKRPLRSQTSERISTQEQPVVQEYQSPRPAPQQPHQPQNPSPIATAVEKPLATGKEWPSVRISEPPTGLNVQQLFAREPGFLRLLFESDGANVALYESDANADAAKSNVERLLASKLERCLRRMPKRRTDLGAGDPARRIFVDLSNGIKEEVVRGLVKSMDGFESLSVVDGKAVVVLSSISEAKRALEDILQSTNLVADFDTLTGSANTSPVAAPRSVTDPSRILRKPPSMPAVMPSAGGPERPRTSMGPGFLPSNRQGRYDATVDENGGRMRSDRISNGPNARSIAEIELRKITEMKGKGGASNGADEWGNSVVADEWGAAAQQEGGSAAESWGASQGMQRKGSHEWSGSVVKDGWGSGRSGSVGDWGASGSTRGRGEWGSYGRGGGFDGRAGSRSVVRDEHGGYQGGEGRGRGGFRGGRGGGGTGRGSAASSSGEWGNLKTQSTDQWGSSTATTEDWGASSGPDNGAVERGEFSGRGGRGRGDSRAVLNGGGRGGGDFGRPNPSTRPFENDARKQTVTSTHRMRGDPRKTIHILFPPDDKAALKRFCIGTLGGERIVLKRSAPVGVKKRGPGGVLQQDSTPTPAGAYGASHCFVVFSSLEASAAAGPKIMQKWPEAVVDYARQEWVVHDDKGDGGEVVDGGEGKDAKEGGGEGSAVDADKNKKKKKSVNPPGSGTPSRVLYIVGAGALNWSEMNGILLDYQGFDELQFNYYHSRAYFKTIDHARAAMDDLLKTTTLHVCFSPVLERNSEKTAGTEKANLAAAEPSSASASTSAPVASTSTASTAENVKKKPSNKKLAAKKKAEAGEGSAEKAEGSDNVDKADKMEKTEKPGKAEEKSDKPEKSEKLEKASKKAEKKGDKKGDKKKKEREGEEADVAPKEDGGDSSESGDGGGKGGGGGGSSGSGSAAPRKPPGGGAGGSAGEKKGAVGKEKGKDSGGGGGGGGGAGAAGAEEKGEKGAKDEEVVERRGREEGREKVSVPPSLPAGRKRRASSAQNLVVVVTTEGDKESGNCGSSNSTVDEEAAGAQAVAELDGAGGRRRSASVGAIRRFTGKRIEAGKAAKEGDDEGIVSLAAGELGGQPGDAAGTVAKATIV
ncbi:hypothetical protein HDU97_008147 [Phlyctochytrium planicorne]|nr:hypothetical protein HDU97_008147 [Phlyctochytrium planicorne]